MASIKKDMIIQYVQRSGIKYKDAIPRALEDLIRARFKCTKYLAKQIVEQLIEKDTDETKNL